MIETKFKQTEIGLIPEDWEVVKLGNLCDIKGRIGFRGYTKEDLVTAGNGAFAIGGKHITHNELNLSDPEYISWNKYYESPEIMVSYGDIVMAQRGTLGRAAIINNDIGYATINPSLLLLKNIKCDNYYLFYYLTNRDTIARILIMSSLTSIPMISQAQFNNFEISLPPIQEQQCIATALSDIDALISALNKKIEKKKLIKQGAMQQLLTGQKRLTGFSEPWVEKRLGEIGNLSMCKRIFQEETSESGDVPFFKIGTFGQQADAYISSTKYEKFKQMYRFPVKGSILISAAGTIGRTVVYDGEPAYFQDSNIVWLAHDEETILNAFLYHVYHIVEWNTENTTIARLYNDNFNNTVINIPVSLSEQAAIAEILSDMDKEIAKLEVKRTKYERIKQGMMQQLLTGKIRLTD